MNHKFEVNYGKCVKCGLCIENCPTKALNYDDYKTPKMEKPKNCMECQHCFAICPVGAISIMGKNPDKSNSLTFFLSAFSSTLGKTFMFSAILSVSPLRNSERLKVAFVLGA